MNDRLDTSFSAGFREATRVILVLGQSSEYALEIPKSVVCKMSQLLRRHGALWTLKHLATNNSDLFHVVANVCSI